MKTAKSAKNTKKKNRFAKTKICVFLHEKNFSHNALDGCFAHKACDERTPADVTVYHVHCGVSVTVWQ